VTGGLLPVISSRLSRYFARKRRRSGAADGGEARPNVSGQRPADSFFSTASRAASGRERRCAQKLGYTRDELIGMTALDINPDVTRSHEPMSFERRLDAGEMIVLEKPPRLARKGRSSVENQGPIVREGGRTTHGGPGRGRHREQAGPSKAPSRPRRNSNEGGGGKDRDCGGPKPELQTIWPPRLDRQSRWSVVTTFLWAACNPEFERFPGMDSRREISGVRYRIAWQVARRGVLHLKASMRGGHSRISKRGFLRKDGSQFDAGMSCASFPDRGEARPGSCTV